MKYLLVALFLSAGLSIPAFAAKGALDTPVNLKGTESHPSYSGVSTCVITNSTDTRAVLCDTGSGIVLDIIGSSVAATDQIVVRDSATANTSSTVLYRLDKAALAEKPNVFPRYKNGLSVNAAVAATAAGPANVPNWIVIYLPLD